MIRPLADLGGTILFKSRLAADNGFRLSTVGEDGQNLALLPNAGITRADDSIADIGAVGLSPDRSMIAFGADETATAYDIWVMPVDGSAAPTKVTTGVAAGTEPDFTEPLKWSPDGRTIAFVADYTTANKQEPYVVPAAGGGQTRLAAIAGDATQDAFTLTWSADGSQIYTIADQRAPNDSELFVLDPTQTDQEPQLVFAVVASGDLNGVRSSP